MDEILTAALIDERLDSISVPALGTGSLHYPSEVMATWLVHSIRQFASTTRTNAQKHLAHKHVRIMAPGGAGELSRGHTGRAGSGELGHGQTGRAAEGSLAEYLLHAMKQQLPPLVIDADTGMGPGPQRGGREGPQRGGMEGPQRGADDILDALQDLRLRRENRSQRIPGPRPQDDDSGRQDALRRLFSSMRVNNSPPHPLIRGAPLTPADRQTGIAITSIAFHHPKFQQNKFQPKFITIENYETANLESLTYSEREFLSLYV